VRWRERSVIMVYRWGRWPGPTRRGAAARSATRQPPGVDSL